MSKRTEPTARLRFSQKDPKSGAVRPANLLVQVDDDRASSWKGVLELAGTELGLCVTTAFQAAAETFNVPPIANGLVLYGEVTFPLDTAAFERKLARVRQMAEEEDARPRL